MKQLDLLIWITQLGISVVAPLAGFTLLAVWLRESLNWGEWTIWCGALLGVINAAFGLRDSLRAMDKHAKRKKPEDAPPPAVSFNDHH